VTFVTMARQRDMTARELAAMLRTVRHTYDVPTLRGLARRALLTPRDDTREMLLHAIVRKLVQLEETN
jgi:hypothetical protein